MDGRKSWATIGERSFGREVRARLAFCGNDDTLPRNLAYRIGPLVHSPVGYAEYQCTKVPIGEGSEPRRAPTRRTTTPQGVSLPSRTPIAVDEASIYGVEAGSSCVR